MRTVAEPKPVRHALGTFAPDEAATAAGRLQIDVDHRGRAVIIHVGGEVDAYTLPVWRRVVREATAQAASPGAVIVDIDGLDFIACCGLATLADETDLCRWRGVTLIVVSRAQIVHRMAAATDLGARLSIRSSMEDAFVGANRVRSAAGDSRIESAP